MPDILTAVKPLLYVSAAFGLGPFAIDEESKSFRVSRYGVCYSLVLTAAFACCSFYGLFRSIELSPRNFKNIRDYTHIVLLACGIVVALCATVLALLQRKKIVSMVMKLQEVDSQMARLGVLMPYDRVFRFCSCGTVGLLLLLVVLLIHDVAVIGPRDFFTWIGYYGPVVYSTYMELQFICSGLLLKKNFAFLNERLIKFGTEGSHPNSERKKLEPIDGGYDGFLESNLIRKASGEPVVAWQNNLSKYHIRKVFPRDIAITPVHLSLPRIKIIRKIHSNLCEVKELLNSSYSLQLLTAIAQAFVIITTNLYMLFTNGNLTGSEQLIMSYPIVWAIFRSLELICITVTCTKISKTVSYLVLHSNKNYTFITFQP